MNLRFFYRLSAISLAAYALAVFVVPASLGVLIDDVSIRVNGPHILFSFFVFAVWALAVIAWLTTTHPQTSDWPQPRPIWLGVVWLFLCVSYTGFEHGWFAFGDVVYEEDGIFESATALALLFCTALFLLIGIGRAWKHDRRLALAVLVLSFICGFLFLEEISWGQRIFGWQTPETMADLNAQSETNLHNMFVGFNQLIRLGIALVISTILLGHVAWRRFFARLGLGELMPPASAVYFVPFLIYAHTYDELFEEVVGVFLIAYAVNLYRRLASQRGTVD